MMMAVEIGELTWTADGRSIIYTRGGDLDGFGENPNPGHQPEEAKQGIFLLSLAGNLRQLAEGHSAVVSSKGDRIAFVFKRDVWSVKLDGSEKASLLFQTKGRSASLHWSPDSTKLSFVSNHGRSHSFVGVYDLGSRTIRYLDSDRRP